MIKSIKDVSVKFLKSNKALVISSIISIFLATIMITAMVTFSISAEENMKESFRKQSQGADIVLMSPKGQNLFNEEYIKNLKSLDEVITATNDVSDVKNKEQNEISMVKVSLKNRDDIYKVSDKIRKINDNVKIQVMEEDKMLQKTLLYLKGFIIFFSLIVVIMSGLFIFSNLQTLVYKYRKQFSVIRSIGGSSYQCFKLVFIQGTYINLVGTLLGFVTSIGILPKLVEKISSIVNVGVGNVVFNYKISLYIMMLIFLFVEIFMLFPAFKSSRILPQRMILDNEALDKKSNFLKYVGIFILALSIIIIIGKIILSYNSMDNFFEGIVSSLLLMVGIYMLLPYFIKGVLKLLMPIFKLIGGKGALVAIKNLIPTVKRNVVIVISLSSLIVLVLFGFNFMTLSDDNAYGPIKARHPLDITITDVQDLEGTLGESIKEELQKMKGVKNVVVESPLEPLNYTYQGDFNKLYYSYTNIDSLVNEGIIEKFKKDIKNTAIISENYAKNHDVSIGDKLIIKYDIENMGKSEDDLKNLKNIDNFNAKSYIVEGVIKDKNSMGGADVFIDWKEKFSIEYTNMGFAYLSSNNIDETKKDIENLRYKYPQLRYSTYEDECREVTDIMNQRWSFLIAIVILVIIITIAGITNMFYNNIMSKKKEYAILRTLKMNKWGILRIILSQISAFIIIGSVTGIIIGVFMRYLVNESMSFLHIDFKYTFIVIGIISIICVMFFIPWGLMLCKQKIADILRLEEER